MKTASTLLLAAALVGSASCKRLLQDIPEVGLGPSRPATSSSSQAESSSTASAQEEEELIDALEADDQITVVSAIQLGELLCDSLVNAENAESLSFVLLEDERVVAEQTSYVVSDGDAFSDSVGRKVWTGVVVDPAQGDDEAVPRTISMTWGDVCDTETFLLKVTKRNLDETTSIVKTVPCFGSTTHTCLFEVMVEFEQADDPLVPESDRVETISTSTGEPSSTTDSTAGEATTTSGSSRRQLQISTDTVVDVMVLYSVSALTAQGGITPQQMDSVIFESIVGSNEAMANSGAAAYLNPVHIGLLPYEVTTRDSATTLSDFQSNGNVAILRDLVGADLVQLVSDFDNSCGRGYVFNADEAFAYSIVRPSCFDNFVHTHLYGHNFGCEHNREDTSRDTEYSHGLRYCDGEDPYRTIMSFTCGSPRVNFFSNPEVMHLNRPTGTETENNARTIGDNMVAVSNYRDPIRPPTPAPTTAPPTTSVPTTAPPTTAPPTTAPPTTAPATTAPPTTAPPTTGPPTTAPPTTAPPTAGPPAAYTLVGCYGDDTRDRVLTGSSVKRDREMTTEVCAEMCQGSPYFGTEFGEECYCGVETDDPDRLGEATCNIDCAGDASQTCGGRSAISVYEYIVLEPEFLGCFRDSRNNRIMQSVQSSNAMTSDLCLQICDSSAFFGLQFGRECWCGDETTDHTINGESTACTRACTGDPDEICGGFNAMSVFRNQT